MREKPMQSMYLEALQTRSVFSGKRKRDRE